MTRLLADLDVLETSGDPRDVEVLGVEHDSRRVGPGALFCCVPGATRDGHAFAAEAVARGAVGLLCERPVPGDLAREVVQVRVAPGGVRPAMARAATTFFGDPASALVTVGVTGTNGKTTVTHLVGAVLAHAGRPVAVIGTLSGVRTTPESTELQRALAAVRDAHPAAPRPVVAMEVSSHALVQSRVDGIRFDMAVFTNLSHDHLDFHGSMEAYFAAKARLFEPGRAAAAVVNVDDEWGQRLAERIRIPLVAVRADLAADVTLAPGGSTFTWRGQHVVLGLTGLVNVHNALLAAETALGLGLSPAEVAAGLASATPVPGRLELVHAPGGDDLPFTVLVDYAHTPAALEIALDEARRLRAPGGRTIVVFGCGGERDRAKRPQMGAVAGRMADLVVVTSDNPRGEAPSAILADVVAGVAPSPERATREGRLVVEPDRRAAIAAAIAAARAGDVVLLAGKGHETYQETAGVRRPFDDRRIAAELIGAHGAASPAAPGD